MRILHALALVPLLGCHSGLLGIENDGTALPTTNMGQSASPAPGSLKVVPMSASDWATHKQKAVAAICDARSGKAAPGDDKALKDAVAFADDWTKGRAEQLSKSQPTQVKGPVTATFHFDDPHDSPLYVHTSLRLDCSGDVGKLVIDDKEYAADLLFSYADPTDQQIKWRGFVALSTKDGAMATVILSTNRMDPKSPYFDGEIVATNVRPFFPEGEIAPVVVPSGHQVYVFLISKADSAAPAPSAFATFGIKVNLGAPDEIRVAKFVVQ